MKATTLMLRQYHRIQGMLSTLADNMTARALMTENVVAAVARFFRLQTEVFEPAVEPLVGSVVRMRPVTRTRARIALFRLATSSPESALFRDNVDELRDVLRAHARHQGAFLRALEADTENPALIRLGNQIEACLHESAPQAAC